MSWPRFVAIVRKEVIQMRRDRRTLALILALPALQLLLFGYAINTVTDHLPTVVFDESGTASSRDLAAAFQNSGYFDVRQWVANRDDAMRAIDSGTAQVALMIPRDFGDLALKGSVAPAQLVVDGSDPNVAQTALFAGGLVARAQASAVADELLNRLGRGGMEPGIDLRPVVLYNPRMASAVFMVPGLVGLIIQLQAVLLTAFAVVRERERGTLEQLVVTPVTSMELMLGKVLPNVLVALISVSVTLTLGRLLFGVVIAGSVPLLFVLTLPFLLASLGIGLLISVVSRTQTQAMQLAMFTLLPTLMLSGFVFARQSMPLLFQLVGDLLPMTYYLEILRGVVLKGVGWSVLWPEFVALVLFAAAMLGISASRFQKRLS